MRYLLALLCPPLSILLCGRPFLAIFSILLLIGYFPAALLALLVASDYYSQRRHYYADRKLDKALTGLNNEMSRHAKLMEKEFREARKAEERQRAAIRAEKKRLLREALGPRKPLISISQIADLAESFKVGAIQAKASAISAYHALPEWAQPVSWGLAAGSVGSLVLVAILVLKR